MAGGERERTWRRGTPIEQQQPPQRQPRHCRGTRPHARGRHVRLGGRGLGTFETGTRRSEAARSETARSEQAALHELMMQVRASLHGDIPPQHLRTARPAANNSPAFVGDLAAALPRVAQQVVCTGTTAAGSFATAPSAPNAAPRPQRAVRASADDFGGGLGEILPVARPMARVQYGANQQAARETRAEERRRAQLEEWGGGLGDVLNGRRRRRRRRRRPGAGSAERRRRGADGARRRRARRDARCATGRRRARAGRRAGAAGARASRPTRSRRSSPR